MTRKHFIQIAAALKLAGATTVTAPQAVSQIAWNMANMMEKDNPRFDRAKFLAACGVQS